jgi:taurine transport system substrate-binding protein
MMGGASLAHAADSVNVAFFLEWATPNQIAKVDKAYDDAMGVDVKWTNFSTGVQMTEAMLAGDIDIAYSQGPCPICDRDPAGRADQNGIGCGDL